MPEGVVVLDGNNRIEWANSRAERHLGIDGRKDRGAPIVNLSPDEATRLAALNAGSVAFLLGFMVLKLVDVIRATERADAAA